MLGFKLPNGLNQFQLRGSKEAFDVDLERKTYSCKLWKLNGIGCFYSVACISFPNRDVDVSPTNLG